MPQQAYSRTYRTPNEVRSNLRVGSVFGYRNVPLSADPTAFYSIHNRTSILFESGSGAYTWRADSVFANQVKVIMDHARDRETDYFGSHRVSQQAYNRAYGMFVEKVSGETSSIGAAIAEWQSSLDMISNRALQLAKAWKLLRRGRVVDFAKSLGVRPKNKHRSGWSRPKDASALWLEYWMGWAPSIADIQSATEVLTNITVPKETVVGYGSRPGHAVFQSAGTGVPTPGNSGACWYKVSCRLQADVELVNPNAYLANRLGLYNPAAIALEVVPFSWLVNWAVNIDQVVSSITDFAGLKLSNIQETTYARTTQPFRGALSLPENQNLPRTQELFMTGECHATRRKLPKTIELPQLVWQLPNRLSLTRAATSCALLASLFTKG